MYRAISIFVVGVVFLAGLHIDYSLLAVVEAQSEGFEFLEAAPRTVTYGDGVITDDAVFDLDSNEWMQFSVSDAPGAPVGVPFDIFLEERNAEGVYERVRKIPDSDYAVPFQNDGGYSDSELTALEQPWFQENGSGINVSRVKRTDLVQYLGLDVSLRQENEDFERNFANFSHLFRGPGHFRLVYDEAFILTQGPRLLPTAYAQSEPLKRYEQPFTVFIDGVGPDDEEPEQCGTLFIDDEVQVPLFDCEDPFNAEADFPYTVTIASSTIAESETYQFIFDSDLPFSILAEDDDADRVALFRQVGNDYFRVLEDGPEDITTVQFSEAGKYVFVALVAPEEVSFLRPLLPSAHAQFDEEDEEDETGPNQGDAYVLSFTVEELVEEPTGASSVLFLPGIQASRLYQDGFFGTEDQVWEPTNLFSQDVRNLRMTADGESLNDIYTRDIIDSVPGIGDVYAEFGNFMDNLVEEDVIVDWTPFAYDWRYDVFDVAEDGTQYENSTENPAEEVLRLAASSTSGRVTIVAHSNGGLLAKAIVDELEAQNQADKVDRIVLIGSPQLGTPKAIGTILHGYDQQAFYRGFVPVIESDIAREVINNLPGAYSLVPAAAYFEQSPVPLVRFGDSDVVNTLRDAYGSEIADFDTYLDFLLGNNETLNRSLDEPVSFPATANEQLLTQAIQNHEDKLDSWIAPDGIEVIEVVGVGLPTMKSILYRGVTETGSCLPDDPSDGCEGDVIVKPFAELTLFGDETVMQVSAEGYPGTKEKYFLNLEEVDDAFPLENFSHGNLTELESVQTLIQAIIEKGEAADIEFISQIEPNLTERYSIEIIDSPVQILAEDGAGNQTGVVGEGENRSIKVEIPGSQYFEFGDTKYLVVPTDTDRTTTLTGEASGGYTLTVVELDASDQEIVHEISNATVTPAMTARYEISDGAFSTVTTDLDGDGVADLETTIDGVIIEPEPAGYKQLREAIRELDLRRIDQRRILFVLRLAERFGKKAKAKPFLKRVEQKLLSRADRQLSRQAARGRINQMELEQIQSIIKLLKQQ